MLFPDHGVKAGWCKPDRKTIRLFQYPLFDHGVKAEILHKGGHNDHSFSNLFSDHGLVGASVQKYTVFSS